MLLNIYTNEDRTQHSLQPYYMPTYGESLILVHQFEANTWLEAMQEYYRFNNWGEFKPHVDDDGKIDPAYFEELKEPIQNV